MSVVAFIRKRSARDPLAHHLLRCFYFYCALFQFHHTIEHVPGVLNVAADALSRNNLPLFFSLLTGLSFSGANPGHRSPPCTQARLGISCMGHTVRQYFANALAPSSLSCYGTAARRYFMFCVRRVGSPPFPISQEVLIRFVAYLAESGLSHATISAYLSGLRFVQIAQGWPDPQLCNFPQLHYVMRGIHRLSGPSVSRRLPITPDLMGALYRVWFQPGLYSLYDCTMLWAACCLGFFGFMTEIRGVHLSISLESGFS